MPDQNWRSKSLESLEKENFGPVPEAESSIVQRLWKLRKIPINEFQVDDIRFMIIQGIGLKYLLIEAIGLISENLLTEGNYYEGDLLNALLQLDKKQWADSNEHWDAVNLLIKGKLEYLRTIRPQLQIDNFYNNKPC